MTATQLPRSCAREEEIGLPAREVHVLGSLDPMLTVTKFWMTPVVGVFNWPFVFRLAPVEVRDVFGAGAIDTYLGGRLICQPVPPRRGISRGRTEEGLC